MEKVVWAVTFEVNKLTFNGKVSYTKSTTVVIC